MIREKLTTEERSLNLKHTIDPGFVNRRKIQTLLGEKGMQIVDREISQLPPQLPDGYREGRIDHIYTQVLLDYCKVFKIKTLEEVLASECVTMFCSTEKLAPCGDIFAERTSSRIIPKGNCEYRVEIQYSTMHISSATLKSELHRGAELSLIAELHQKEGDLLIFHPFIIGFPWLFSDNPEWEEKIMWWRYDFFENFIEDFDEFGKVKKTPESKSYEPMRDISEQAFKTCLAEILGDPTKKDWGGEASDHYTAHLHLNGKRVTAAFLLKGPSRFASMGLNHLGKNNDQIYRLSQEPAEVLFVQHCHEITQPVRATLRAFAVQPSRPRRYCLIDGKDSLWLLKAYGLYEKAIELSKK